MAYLREYQLRGDPFLGSLFGKAIGLAKGAFGLGGGKAPSAGAIAKEVAARVGGGLKRIPRGAVGPGVGAAAGLAAGYGAGAMFGGGGGRRYRRTNVGNVKALRRAMRRVEGFSKLARKTITFTKTRKLKKKGRR